MIRVENKLGCIKITHRYFADLVARTATNCFGVAGMMPAGPTQELRSLARLNSPAEGVQVRVVNGRLHIALHIAVAYGVNIAAVVNSISSEVRYAVEKRAGLKVGRVSVFIDALRTE